MGLDISIYNSNKTKELMYWRKANHIVTFMDTVLGHDIENCEYYKIDRSTLELLRNSCIRVYGMRHSMSLQMVSVDFKFHKSYVDEYGNAMFIVETENGSNAVDERGSWRVSSRMTLDEMCADRENNGYKLLDGLPLVMKPTDVLLNEIKNAGLAPCTGFFFGGQDIDEWYFDSLKSTIEMCNTVLATRNRSFYFTANW